MLQCKEKMRPVKRALKMLESPEENMNESDQVAQTRQVWWSHNCWRPCPYSTVLLALTISLNTLAKKARR